MYITYISIEAYNSIGVFHINTKVFTSVFGRYNCGAPYFKNHPEVAKRFYWI